MDQLCCSYIFNSSTMIFWYTASVCRELHIYDGLIDGCWVMTTQSLSEGTRSAKCLKITFPSHAFVHLILLWSWMVCSRLIRWLVVFVCNALTCYSSSPPFNLFGPEPTLNAQIASFHRDSSVSRAVLLHWAPDRPLGHCLPFPEKEVEPVGSVQWSGLVLISHWRCFGESFFIHLLCRVSVPLTLNK